MEGEIIPNEILDAICEVLAEKKDKFSIIEVYKILNEEKKIEVSLTTVIKYVEIGIASGRIKERDYGNVRIIWVEGENGRIQ